MELTSQPEAPETPSWDSKCRVESIQTSVMLREPVASEVSPCGLTLEAFPGTCRARDFSVAGAPSK